MRAGNTNFSLSAQLIIQRIELPLQVRLLPRPCRVLRKMHFWVIVGWQDLR